MPKKSEGLKKPIFKLNGLSIKKSRQFQCPHERLNLVLNKLHHKNLYYKTSNCSSFAKNEIIFNVAKHTLLISYA